MTPSRPRCLTVAATVVLLLALGGCGEAEIAPPPIHDLAEPWQARPFAVDQSLVMSAEKLCRDIWTDSIPAGMQLFLVDARGANNMLLLFVGAGGNYECFVERDRIGRLKTTGGGGGSRPPEPPVGPNGVVVQGQAPKAVPRSRISLKRRAVMLLGEPGPMWPLSKSSSLPQVRFGRA